MVKRWLANITRSCTSCRTGRTIDLYKDIGTPAQVAERYDFRRSPARTWSATRAWPPNRP
jgi:glutamate synthase domain-containing protein 1